MPKRKVEAVSGFLRRNLGKILVFFVVYLVLLASAVHNSYPDEFDNILGGRLIDKGILPYIGFFSHHGSFAYFLSAFFELFSGQSFVRFRFLTSIFYLALAVVSYEVITRRLNEKWKSFVLIFWLLLSVSLTFFWGHMFLADSLCGFFLFPPYAIFMLRNYFGEKYDRKDLIAISLYTSAAFLTSPTYSYAIGILLFAVFVSFIWEIRGEKRSKILKLISEFVLIFSIPYLIFGIYLVVTRSVSDYYFQAVIYNKNYYIYNYPRPEGSTVFNPIRYALVIVNKFLDNYQPLLAGLSSVNFNSPMALSLGLTNIVFWLFLVIKKKYFLFAVSLLFIIYLTVRNDPGVMMATDYTSSSYIMAILLEGVFLIYLYFVDFQSIKNSFGRILLGAAGVLFLVMFFYTQLFLFTGFWQITYSRIMGTMPLIYDRPQVAEIVNSIVSADRYCWVGPFAFEEMFYLNCKLPSKYHWILPQFSRIKWLENDLVTDYTNNRAMVIVYDRNYSAFGQSAEYNGFFINFLNQNYLRLSQIEPEKHWRFKNPKTQNFNLDTDFNFEKGNAVSLVNKLAENGYLVSENK